MSADRPTGLSTTLLLGAAAVGAAIIAMFGEAGGFSVTTVVASLVGLVPWALVVGGIPVPPPLFALMAFVPGAYMVVVDDNPGGMFPLMLLVVWITRESSSRLLVGATIAASSACIIGLAAEQGSHESGCFYFLGGVGISALAGVMLRRQESLTTELQAMHELRVEQLAATERARIARDVHDVVAHSLTVVMLNLTGARRALAAQPERADEELARAEAVGRESLESIRQVMGLLREPGSADDVPQPGIIDVGALVDGYRSAGLPVESTVDPSLQGIDPTVQLVVFRVVQESLSNVLLHAPGAASRVEVALTEPSWLSVTVDNEPTVEAPPRRARSGLGVRGMVERVRAVSGELHAGASADGGWRVAAHIPVRVAGTDRADETAWATEPTAR